MRAAFVKKLVEIAEADPRVVLLTADLGFMALEPFSDRFPDRFFNIGVAEQNMVGIATGLAEAGFIPFVYSITTFATLRPYEFIRNGPILHGLPVRIVGVGGGFEYSHAGPSHYGMDDVGALRVQPGISIFAPADAAQASTVIQKTWDMPGPIFYRLGKDDRTFISELDGRFEKDSAQVLREGKDCLILAMGSIAPEALKAADMLKARGVSAEIAVLASLQPAPITALVKMIERFSLVVTLEAHYVSGALGSVICEIVAENALRTRVVRCAVRSTPDGKTGSQNYLHNLHGLSAEKVAAAVLNARATGPVPSV